jgi:hypothetical protein
MPGEAQIGEISFSNRLHPLLFSSFTKRRREAERRQTLVTTATSCDAARTLQGALVCRRSTTALT